MSDFYRFEAARMLSGEGGGEMEAQGARLYIEGEIHSPQAWFDWSTFTFHPPEGFRQQMAALEGQDLTVYIDSNGGSCEAGMGLYTALRARKGKTRCEVTRAYSAATLVMAGCDKGARLLSPSAVLLYHNPSLGAEGDHTALEKALEYLNKLKGAVMAAYCESSGMEETAIAALMDAETFYTAREAVAAGWADGILPVGGAAMSACAPVGVRDVVKACAKATEEGFIAALNAGMDNEREGILRYAKDVLGRKD